LRELPTPAELRARIGEKVDVAGWVHDVRLLGGINFVLLRNSRGIVQITAPKKTTPPELLASITSLHQEDVISCLGIIRESKVAKNGFEILPEALEIIGRASVPLPLDPRGVTGASLDTRLTWRSLDLRRPESLAVFTIEDALVTGMESYLHEQGFIRAFTPSIIGGISEGGSEVFKIDFYGKDAFLRQDPQLHRQLAIAGGLDRVYDLGANWRAEMSHTPVHLSEHRTIAPEMSFIKDERDTMRVEERMVAQAVRSAISQCQGSLAVLGLNILEPQTPFPELEFPEIYGVLEKMGHKIPRGEDLDTEAYRLLGKHVMETSDSQFFFLNRFPSKAKPFYVMRVDESPEWARSVDLVFKGVELSSGGQREHRYEKIMTQIQEKGVGAEGLKWFTEPFRYGVPPHGGYSLGIERFTALLTNLANVKEAVLFPRDPERLKP
jgi:aspartyl-tRNA synthetase